MPIWPENVIREVNIAKAPQHVALVWRCDECGTKSRVVATKESWDARQAVSEEFREQRFNKMAAIELDAVESADDLVALWASLPDPPIREKVMGACGCFQCRRRLYG